LWLLGYYFGEERKLKKSLINTFLDFKKSLL
jgi:hypothetical protein